MAHKVCLDRNSNDMINSWLLGKAQLIRNTILNTNRQKLFPRERMSIIVYSSQSTVYFTANNQYMLQLDAQPRCNYLLITINEEWRFN